ncbi:hypothetical protein W97_05667 [Coniosporium apollinis CBS 100218]|uniref:Heterokaryon incompatibility domain-containing protein n=1 Tax=Coniosporium apollinis (strain CBS 100218) TaxID=1168221 RepID=R7YWT5_CONA1|nr:uncharacterized protein W97_05667 [Coniosporium apollinis CBS 100218]EON66274.1 hypothetical protein W97_05667 [Coniosporium apollinis CBS 100218]
MAGTIVRADEEKLGDSNRLRSPNFKSEETFHIRGRPIPPKANLDLMKQWMQFCGSEHHECRTPTLTVSKTQSIRLIDVQEHKIILTSSAKDYVALSYVWGPTTAPLLTRETLSQYSATNGLKDAIIPRTISDAMGLVRDLGTRYLWVDSLCIVQDDDDDKKQQLPMMGSIYNCAELLILAATGSDAHAGLYSTQNTKRREPQPIEEVDGIPFTTAQPPAQETLMWTTWNRRGWTFQEAILSRRVLIFTDGQVY